MKSQMTLMTGLIILTSGPTFACPDLSGRYQISETPGAYTLSFAQKSAGQVTTYAVKSEAFGFPAEKIIADGRAHSLKNSIHGRGHQNPQYVASCDGDILSYRYDGDLVLGSDSVQHVTELRTYQLDENKDLVTTMNLIVNGATAPIPGTTTKESKSIFYRVK